MRVLRGGVGERERERERERNLQDSKKLMMAKVGRGELRRL